jgi:formate-dependent nitrite reductase membrane component NrfD
MKDKPQSAGYYGLPAIHGPHWNWLIIFYFFFGGIAGAAQAIGAIASWRDQRGNHAVVRAARYVSFAAFLPCPALLVFDLGRPERFLHMLRILKLRSPMSVGSWTLVLFGAAATTVVAGQVIEDQPRIAPGPARALARRLANPAGPAAAMLGVLLSAYTAVLLAATAVPLWAKRHLLLAPIFVASAMAAAAASIELALTLTRTHSGVAARRLATFEGICSAAEVGVIAAWFAALGPTRKPLATGTAAPVFRNLVVGAGLAAPLTLRAIRRRLPPPYRAPAEIVAALATLVGGLSLRYAIVVAGAESADDPEATFAFAARKRPANEG